MGLTLILQRIALPLVILGTLHFVFVQILLRVRLLEHLLSPGPGSTVALIVTAIFLLFRFFLLVLAPGWFLARFWVWMTKRKPAADPQPT